MAASPGVITFGTTFETWGTIAVKKAKNPVTMWTFLLCKMLYINLLYFALFFLVFYAQKDAFFAPKIIFFCGFFISIAIIFVQITCIVA